MPKLVLARGDISALDELVIVLSEPDNEPAAVLIHWPPAASVASPMAFPTRPARSPRSSPAPPYGSHNTKHGGCRHWKIRTPGALNRHQGFFTFSDPVWATTPPDMLQLGQGPWLAKLTVCDVTTAGSKFLSRR